MTPMAIGKPLESLQVRGLTHRFPDGEEGLEDVDLDVEQGSFTVITGKIGSGKSTLVRALLGLVPSTGEIYWNGELVEDPASFFVPPRSAYTAQVPRLFSESLADNIALGKRATRERLREAVQLAVLDPDLERMEHGLETMVGARGVKLSGGQVQRSAAARMLATEAELLVFDDLSSALDLHTEAELWKRLFEKARGDLSGGVASKGGSGPGGPGPADGSRPADRPGPPVGAARPFAAHARAVGGRRALSRFLSGRFAIEDAICPQSWIASSGV